MSSSPASSSAETGGAAAAGFEVLRVETEAEREDRALARWVRQAAEERARGGVRVEAEVRKNRNFRNPAILQKMIDYCAIDEHATAISRVRHNHTD